MFFLLKNDKTSISHSNVNHEKNLEREILLLSPSSHQQCSITTQFCAVSRPKCWFSLSLRDVPDTDTARAFSYLGRVGLYNGPYEVIRVNWYLTSQSVCLVLIGWWRLPVDWAGTGLVSLIIILSCRLKSSQQLQRAGRTQDQLTVMQSAQWW